MKYRKITDDTIEIIPENTPVQQLLEEMARVSYELAETIPPWFVQPFDIPSSAVNFRELINEKGLALDYLNGRLCSTYVMVRQNRLFFDSRRFKQDRGSPVLFLELVKERVASSQPENSKNMD